MVFSAKSDNSNTISQFTRRKPITITTGGTSTPVNYQVKLTITYESEMQADFDDIRFNTSDRDYIDYWIESYTASTATVWVELPDAITHPGSDTIMMYYGNSGLSDGGVGADTFIQYHGSATANYHDTNIFLNNIVYESKIKSTLVALAGVSTALPFGNYDSIYIKSSIYSSLRILTSKNNALFTEVSESPSWPVGIYVRLKITFNGSNIHGYVDDNEIASGITTNLPNENMGLWLTIGSGNVTQDWSFVRKYIANDPTLSYGTAQHQRRVPQIF